MLPPTADRGARTLFGVILLAIDTATPAVTAGIVRLTPAAQPGARPDLATLAQRVTVDARAHGELLTPHIQEALRAAGLRLADVDAIVCGAGPGPFTGLRVGMVTAAALGHALELSVYPVCTLDAIAADVFDATGWVEGAEGTDPLLVVTDARRREVYWASYAAGPGAVGQRLDGPAVTRPAVLAEQLAEADAAGGGPRRMAGQGAGLYADVLGLPVLTPEFPSPRGLAAVAADAVLAKADPAPLTPLYLRRPDAVEPGAPKKVAT